MSNLELVTTIISIILTIFGSVLGFIAKRNDKAKKYYEGFIEVQEKIKELCVVAESSYTNGDQKKKYVVTSTHVFLKELNISISDEKINTIIESVINLSKKIN